jgi:hypothetical protein
VQAVAHVEGMAAGVSRLDQLMIGTKFGKIKISYFDERE